MYKMDDDIMYEATAVNGPVDYETFTPAPAPGTPISEDPSPEATSPDQLSPQDFMLSIPVNTRSYSHLPSNLSSRSDFTSTLLFFSASSLSHFTFHLSDQVSQFQILVNVYTPSGKIGTAKKTIISSKNMYIQYTMPISMVKGDRLQVPIQIVNNKLKANKAKVHINGEMVKEVEVKAMD